MQERIAAEEAEREEVRQLQMLHNLPLLTSHTGGNAQQIQPAVCCVEDSEVSQHWSQGIKQHFVSMSMHTRPQPHAKH